MNYPSNSDTNLNSAYPLEAQFSNLVLQNDTTFEYGEVGGEEVLYVTQQELLTEETYAYPDHPVPQLDSANSSSSTLSSHWEYVSPDTKSLDTVVGELGPEEVRWFYKSDSDKRWVEFSGYDSLRIEFKYRQLFHEYSYYASYNVQEDCGDTYFDQSSQSALNAEAASNVDSSYETSEAGSEQRIVVRGGMYEVDLQMWKCQSIYWPGEECVITRGAWFYDGSWQPLEVEQSVRLETVHLQLFYGHKLADYIGDPGKTPKAVLHTESFPDFHVDWYSPVEVYLYSEATPSKLVRSFTQRLGFQKSTGYRLYRGYKLHATQTDRPVDITHLVFVIHGIGQKMDTGRIIRNTSTFRDCVTWLKQKYFASSTEHRAEFFPVEWRSSLRLDGDIVEAITPHKLLGLRQMLNSSAMDIMYYTSPLYGFEVQRGLREELNRLYAMFSQRNPYFVANGGKVSVIAHSLGCVIVYDIVTGWRPDSWQPTVCPTCSQPGPSQPRLSPSIPGLLFEIDNLFCLGSPLAVFLALRVRNPEATEHGAHVVPPSLCQRMYNVFHPSDPVAYRMEPLVSREYRCVAPLQIQAYNAAQHIPYSELPLEPTLPEATTTTTTATTTPRKVPQELAGAALAVGDEVESPTNTPSKDRGWSLWGLMRGNWRPQDGAGSSQTPSATDLTHRLDYVLRETNIGGSYVSALTSHTAYWGNYDVAYFVLTRLFPDLDVKTPTQATPDAGTPK